MKILGCPIIFTSYLSLPFLEDDPKIEDVMSLEEGVFTAPAAGLYTLTFTVTIDNINRKDSSYKCFDVISLISVVL